jgi:hypothetical protein
MTQNTESPETPGGFSGVWGSNMGLWVDLRVYER